MLSFPKSIFLSIPIILTSLEPVHSAGMTREEFLAICRPEASLDKCWGYIDGVVDANIPKGWLFVGCPPLTIKDRSETFYDAIIEDVRSVNWMGQGYPASSSIQAATFRTTYEKPGCVPPAN